MTKRWIRTNGGLPVDNPMRKWEPLDREWVSKSNVMEQGARVQQGGEEYMSRMGFWAHLLSCHISKAAGSEL